MDPKPDRSMVLLAPPRSGGGAALSFPPSGSRSGRFPPVDEHIVVPETTRDEMIRGRKVSAQPALEPHADLQTSLDFLILPHVRPGYRPSTELLTRVAEGSNFATDLSIRREGQDPATGRRFLEEISFEIVNEQSVRDVVEKAEELAERGVRRVFAIFVKRREVCEWSPEKHAFVPLLLDGMLEDPCFVRPIAVRALLDVQNAEREVVRALERKGNAELERLKEGARDAGREEGRREALGTLLRARFGEISADAEARIAGATRATLDAWILRLLDAKTIDEVFAEP
ncbi:hypothetical protein [Polyangium sp. y55x31]|uniref:hypothetical protein n=1 Tax=Polyangium sp. y55x31 TaxID=3042688 RepID=UPI0024827E47|nr:hypothetical protein [Polyangium sp. y55x31]MDI1481710.1 hypothetical protein [Polyangium sp. y55x31]